jgi:N-ethylmaleimide reductase
MTTAFDPIALGRARLANRLVTAPTTRSRAFGPGAEPTELLTTDHAQRAGTGSAW